MDKDALTRKVDTNLVRIIRHAQHLDKGVFLLQVDNGIITAFSINRIAFDIETKTQNSLIDLVILWGCSTIMLYVLVYNVVVHIFGDSLNVFERNLLVRVVHER